MKLSSFEYSGLGGDLPYVGEELSKDVQNGKGDDPQLHMQVSVQSHFDCRGLFFQAVNFVTHWDIILLFKSYLIKK